MECSSKVKCDIFVDISLHYSAVVWTLECHCVVLCSNSLALIIILSDCQNHLMSLINRRLCASFILNRNFHSSAVENIIQQHYCDLFINICNTLLAFLHNGL